MRGYVYVLTNEHMPGLVKIGRSVDGGKKRAKEITSVTGVPGEYIVAFEILVDDCVLIESLVHESLECCRLGNKEIFQIDAKPAMYWVLDAILTNMKMGIVPDFVADNFNNEIIEDEKNNADSTCH